MKVESSVDFDPIAPIGMSYSVVYGNGISEELIEPHAALLQNALGQIGYQLSSPEEANVFVYVLTSIDELVLATREMSTKEMGVPVNPDSIRHKNVAAMIGGGRYPELLNDNPNAPGNVIMGPNGELIETGNLRRRESGERPTVEETLRINRFKMSAVEAPLPANPDDVEIRWQVEVVSELPLQRPKPSIPDLLQAASDDLLEKHR